MNLALRAHGFEATFLPQYGGLLSRLTWQADGAIFDLLYPATTEAISQPMIFGGLWPMVPFANRAFGARLVDGACSWRLPVNEPAAGHCLHGFGWQHAWTVSKQSETSIRLNHVRTQGVDPFRYSCNFDFRIERDHVRAELTVTNLAHQSLPYGLGFHPWFHRDGDSVLSLSAHGHLEMESAQPPTGYVSTPSGGPFANGATTTRARETAWSFVELWGTTSITSARRGLALDLRMSESFQHPYVWLPSAEPYFCVEPQSHSSGAPSEALARSITPMARLEPNASFSGWFEMRPRTIRRPANDQ